jgi:hypothetical protein
MADMDEKRALMAVAFAFLVGTAPLIGAAQEAGSSRKATAVEPEALCKTPSCLKQLPSAEAARSPKGPEAVAPASAAPVPQPPATPTEGSKAVELSTPSKSRSESKKNAPCPIPPDC